MKRTCAALLAAAMLLCLFAGAALAQAANPTPKQAAVLTPRPAANPTPKRAGRPTPKPVTTATPRPAATAAPTAAPTTEPTATPIATATPAPTPTAAPTATPTAEPEAATALVFTPGAPSRTATPNPTQTPAQGAAKTPRAEVVLLTPDPLLSEERAEAGVGERLLRGGMTGEDVAVVQQRLSDLGYYAGDVDGEFGRFTGTAVKAFQRANGLEKVDGMVGPETLSALFSARAVPAPTPTPSPTPRPTPTPTPSPSPVPLPLPTATPDVSAAPLSLAPGTLMIAGRETELLLGETEDGEALYPLCGVLGHLGFTCAYADGSWQFTRGREELALVTDGAEGLCENAMGAVDGVIFLTDERVRVYACQGEAYVTREALRAFGAPLRDVRGVLTVD